MKDSSDLVVAVAVVDDIVFGFVGNGDLTVFATGLTGDGLGEGPPKERPGEVGG